MPVSTIINGYYRSGTTFFWDVFRENTRMEGTRVFYEPLHPRLNLHVARERDIARESLLHGGLIWESYNDLGAYERHRILKNHPNAPDGTYGGHSSRIADYLAGYHELPGNVILQTNRLHFFLDDCLHIHPDWKLIHIIRNPMDVYASMRKGIYRSDNPVKSAAKRLLSWRNEFFDVHREYEWIRHRLGADYRSFFSWSGRLRHAGAFEKFAVVYTLSNYYAIKSLEGKGLVAPYEWFTENPAVASGRIGQFLGRDFRIPAEKVRTRDRQPNPAFWEKFHRCLRRHHLEPAYGEICEFLSGEYGLTHYK